MDFTAISLPAFKGCTRLTTIEFSSGISGIPPTRLKEVLTDMGFHPSSLNNALYGHGSSLSDKSEMGGLMYYNIKLWARKRNKDTSRLLLCTAAAHSIKWADMEGIFIANMRAICEIDVVTGFPLFMLAAVGSKSDIESVYHLCREQPGYFSK